ncbi:GNAT family N-acetyltransferase [Martelella alba]|nr:GNAT family N-acetyltransferase [Martelella alba]
MMLTEAVIRPARPEDEPALYGICLQTANAGADATALYSDPDYPGQRFVIPYVRFAPRFAFVLESGGQVMGYVVAAPDSEVFERALARQWWPALREQYRDRVAEAPLDDKVLAAIRHPTAPSPALTRRWPAHLHINLLPPAQKGGWGRKLIETELDALRQAGIAGVHLGVSLQNEQVCGFYQRLGFEHVLRGNAIYMAQRL